MPPWGIPGGGPLNADQVTDVVNYLRTIQVPQEENLADVEPGINGALDALATADATVEAAILAQRQVLAQIEAAERDDVWQRGYAGKRERDRLLLALFACAGLRRAGSRAAKSGGGGIRTHEGLARPAAFKTGRKVPICRQSSARSPVGSPASDQLCKPQRRHGRAEAASMRQVPESGSKRRAYAIQASRDLLASPRAQIDDCGKHRNDRRDDEWRTERDGVAPARSSGSLRRRAQNGS